MKTSVCQKLDHKCSHSFIHDSLKLETIWMFISKEMAYLYNEILLSSEKEGTVSTGYELVSKIWVKKVKIIGCQWWGKSREDW